MALWLAIASKDFTEDLAVFFIPVVLVLYAHGGAHDVAAALVGRQAGAIIFGAIGAPILEERPRMAAAFQGVDSLVWTTLLCVLILGPGVLIPRDFVFIGFYCGGMDSLSGILEAGRVLVIGAGGLGDRSSNISWELVSGN